jgi:hypothetical protein
MKKFSLSQSLTAAEDRAIGVVGYSHHNRCIGRGAYLSRGFHTQLARQILAPVS